MDAESYDLSGRVLLLDGYRYTYDPVGNRTSMQSLRDDVLHEYTYDAVDRLTRWQRGTERFDFDYLTAVAITDSVSGAVGGAGFDFGLAAGVGFSFAE